MINIRRIAIVLTFCLCVSAMAEITTLVEAVEITASNLRVPTSNSGFLAFRPCAEECDEEFVRVRLTAATKFAVAGRAMSFVDFRKAFAGIGRGSDTYILVSYETEKSTVTSVQIGE